MPTSYVAIDPVPAGDIPSVHGRAITPGNEFYGPIEYGGKLWAFLEVGQDSTDYWSDWHIAVWYSTDGGNNWVEADVANHPVGHEVNGSVFYEGGSIVWVAFKKRLSSTAGDYALVIQSFNLTNGLWGAQIGSGPDPGGGYTGTKLVRLGADDYLVSTNTTSSRDAGAFPTNGIYYIRCTGGVWAAPVLIASPATPQNLQIQLDSGIVHFYYANAGFSSTTLYHRGLDTGTWGLGTSQTLDTTVIDKTIGCPVISGGNLIVPYVQKSGSNFYPWVAVGNSGAIDPTWSLQQVSSTIEAMPPYNPDNASTFAIESAGSLYLFWVTPAPVYGSGGMNSIYYSVYSGSWGAPVLWHTEAASNPYQDWFHNPSLTVLSGGTFGLVVDRIHRTASGNFWSVTGYIGVAPSPPVPPSPGPGQLGSARTILHIWQQAISPQVEITTDRRGDWTECGTPSNKFFQGVKIDADTFGVDKIVQIRDADSNTLHVLEPAVVNHSGRQTVPYSFGTPFVAHSVRDEPQDLVPWRNFGLEYIFEPSPESVFTWQTQKTAHGLSGYMHVQKIDVAYEATAPVTLSIACYDGTSPTPIVLPATGGVYGKALVILTPNKGQLYQYSVVSGAAFRIFLNDWVVWVGQWGRTDSYMAYRLLGGETGDKARI